MAVRLVAISNLFLSVVIVAFVLLVVLSILLIALPLCPLRSSTLGTGTVFLPLTLNSDISFLKTDLFLAVSLKLFKVLFFVYSTKIIKQNFLPQASSAFSIPLAEFLNGILISIVSFLKAASVTLVYGVAKHTLTTDFFAMLFVPPS